MKNKIRIKINKESQKSKNLREVILITEGNKSFEMRKFLQKQDKKVDFLKKLSLYL